ncbi:kinase-like protein [Auricularia subglabra TFB-10046 SS5]|nr:kinase-like protein [Auricularia subglabra TFB-10046 SS5]
MNALASALQAAPVPALGAAVSLVNAIWTDVQTVQSNKAQCRRLAERAAWVLSSVQNTVQSQTQDGYGPPDTVQRNIAELERVLEEVSSFVTSLAKQSFFRRFLNKNEIEDKVEDYNQQLQTCCSLFSMNAAINMQGWLVQDQRDREADSQEMQAMLRLAVQNDAAIMRTMQLNQDQLIDAMQALHKRLDEFTRGSVERQFAESGLATLQRMSGSSPGKEPDWVISPFDLEWDETPMDSGGFGTVHRGLWRRTEVAIKFLPSETRQKVLMNEVNIWSKLSHPNIHRFLGCSLRSDPPFLVSELCKRGNALTYLRKYPRANRASLVYQIANGMEYLHSKGVLHGDLKASNVLIDERGGALITDFGLSGIFLDISVQSHRTMVPVAAGADRWKAPEALESGQLTKKTDVYSWAMTALELFTGRPPFGHIFDIYTHVVTNGRAPARPSEREAPGLSSDMWTLITEAMARNPDARPSFTAAAQRISRMLRTPSPLPGANPLPAVLPIAPQPPPKVHVPIFHFPGRLSTWVDALANSTFACTSYFESEPLRLDLRQPVTLSAWARRGSVLEGKPPPKRARCVVSLEAPGDRAQSLVSVGLEGGMQSGPLCAALRPLAQAGPATLTCQNPMPALRRPRAEWNRSMWVHVALVWAGGGARLYMNGILHASAQIVPFEHRENVRVVIGRGIEGGRSAHQWDGMVENVKVFQAALSSEEVAREMASKRPALQGSGYIVGPYDQPPS